MSGESVYRLFVVFLLLCVASCGLAEQKVHGLGEVVGECEAGGRNRTRRSEVNAHDDLTDSSSTEHLNRAHFNAHCRPDLCGAKT